MKKILSLIFVTIFLCLACVGCSSKKDEDNKIIIDETESTVSTTIEMGETDESQTENQESQTDKQTQQANSTTTTKKSQGNALLTDEEMEKLENSNAQVYFSDNPNNKYIVAIANKYGAPKENMVALIKTEAEFPSVTVFEFSGKRDANGELIMTYAELKNIYEINVEESTVARISKNGLDNDGVTFVEAQVFLTLAKEYLIPELPNLKANSRYPE